MKRIMFLVLMLLLLITSANGVMAQGMDADGDGVPFRRDNCPGVAGPESNNGCPFQADGFVIELDPTVPPPPADTDSDGLPDSDDQCPTVAGSREDRGCPPPPPPVTEPPSSAPLVEVPPASEPQPVDTDGDGTVDAGDECPTVSGPRENRGCPVDNPSTEPQPASDDLTSNPPPFVPPLLPTYECFVTSANGNNINVRKEPNTNADVIGSLLPGVVYPALGYVMNGAETWFVLTGYVGSVGETGYSSGSVLLSSAICAPYAEPELPPVVTGDPSRDIATDFQDPSINRPTLCFLSVGYDSPTWSDDPAVPSVRYASFWFESAPGAPLAAGTKAWGVISVEDFISLPDSENIFAVAPSQSLYEEAVNSGYGGTYNWPTLAGGIISGDQTLYRMTDPVHYGSCGPIFGIGGLTQDNGDLNPPEPNGDTRPTVLTTGNGGDPQIDELVAAPTDGDGPSDLFAAIDAEDETRKEDPAWWENAMPLICGGGDFIILTETDEDGDEVVTDAQCEDSIEMGGDEQSDLFLAIDAEDETRKEDPAWWENAMPLICGGGDFIILTETDEDGDEVVTDAQCEDSIE